MINGRFPPNLYFTATVKIHRSSFIIHHSSFKKMVGIIMGSLSDWKIMAGAVEILELLEIPYEKEVVSAHRTPQKMLEYALTARRRGLKVIIAGAGGAAHLPGMVSSSTTLPVIGVPIKSSNSIDGWDSILSILQMPAGVPVATVSLNGAKNAGILAAQILGVADEEIAKRLRAYREGLKDLVEEMNEELQKSV